MLWPIVLPFAITACVLLTLVFVAPVVKWRRVPTSIGMTLLSLIAFVPSCTGIMRILDADRFGVIEYASFDNVDDFRVERYLPPPATNITVDKYAQGFRARFTISQSQLDAYLDDVWRKYGDRGPTAGNGAGFTIWFSPSEGVAYQRGSYW